MTTTLLKYLEKNVKVLHKTKTVPLSTSKAGIYFVSDTSKAGLYVVSNGAVKKIFDIADHYVKSEVNTSINNAKTEVTNSFIAADSILSAQIANLSNLSIRKGYTTKALMVADTSPVGTDGQPILQGQLVAVTGDATTTNNGVWFRSGTSWQQLFSLPDLSNYIPESNFNERVQQAIDETYLKKTTYKTLNLTANKFSGSPFVWNNEFYYIGVVAGYSIYIYKEDGTLVKQIPIASVNNSEGLKAYVLGDTLHILSFPNKFVEGADRLRGVEYYTYDMISGTLSARRQYLFAGGVMYQAGDMVYYKGALHAAVSYMYDLNTTTISASNMMVTLLRLNPSTSLWEDYGVIAQSSEEWGDKWTDGSNFTRETLNSMNPYTCNLSTDDTYLYASISSLAANNLGFNRLVFEKRCVEDYAWRQFNIETEFKSKDSRLIFHEGKKFALFLRDYSYNLNGGNLSIAEVNSKSIYYLPFNDYPHNSIGIFVSGNDIYIADECVKAGIQRVTFIKTTFAELMDHMNVKRINYRGVAYPSTNPTNPKAGDYYKTMQVGSYPNFVTGIYPQLSVITTYTHRLDFGEEAYVVYDGKYWHRQIISDYNLVKKTSIPFPYNFYRNPLWSQFFRIPSITKGTDGAILLVSDIRYTGAADYGHMQIGFCKSYDNGKTWQDHTVALQRDNDHYSSIMNPSIVVDNDASSPYYGRIWIAAGQYNVNKAHAQYTESEWALSEVYMTYSDDFGLTWVPKINITHLFPYKRIAVPGCSAGICLNGGRIKVDDLTDKSAKGTLIIPFYYTYFVDPNNPETSEKIGGSTFIYKEQDSTNWKLGDLALIPNECGIAEMKNGNLILSGRHSQTRKIYELETIGRGWTRREDLESTLLGTDIFGGCSEPIRRYKNTWLISKPTNFSDTDGTRKNIKVFYCYDLDEGDWQEAAEITTVNMKSGGYSDIVVDDYTFGCAYEANELGDLSYADLNYLRNILK